MGSRVIVSWASFLPVFSLLRLFILDLGSGTGQTDRRRPLKLYAPTLGAGIINSLKLPKWSHRSCGFLCYRTKKWNL